MLIIRADGNAKIGAGHMMRCLTIAQAVRELHACGEDNGVDQDTEVLFLCADEDSAKLARDNGFRAEVLHTDYQNMESELEQPAGSVIAKEAKVRSGWEKWVAGTEHTILVDSYYVTDAYLQMLHSYGRVFLLDDLQKHGYPVDGVINYNVFADSKVYRALYPGAETRCFLGAQYAPLREQFRKAEYGIREKVHNVLITTGGGDVDNIAAQILDAVYDSNRIFHVLVGRFSPHYQDWQQRAKETENIRLHVNVQNMAELMMECDLAITAGGSTVYELAAVGVPFICFSYAENQELLVEHIGQNEIAGSAGAWHLDREACREKIRRTFTELCESRDLRERYSERERKMTDGKGALRIAEILGSGESLKKELEKKDLEKKDFKNNMRYWIAAGIFFAMFLAGLLAVQAAGRGCAQYDVVVFGDSLMGLCRDETSVTAVLEELSGQSVYNAAFGGTCMAVQDEDLEYNYTMALLNMVSLSKALAADDFGVQQTVRSRREITDYFEDVIAELPGIDFRRVHTIVIAFGLNDYHSGIPVDNAEDPFDENTYGGALRSVLRSVRKTCPDAQVIVVTPTYAWYLSNGLTCEEYVIGEDFLEDYVQKELEIAAEFDIPAVDLYHDVYEHGEWDDWARYTIDGLHPNEESRRIIAGKLADRIQAGGRDDRERE